eukprot:Tamp_16119.p1 GENE.Tamp_16119~~Tamp_16119.p1  ORF type:complete len:487 (+),score=66.75 Tamp_16119:216-1463(+)
MSGLELEDKTLVPNHALRNAIQEYLEEKEKAASSADAPPAPPPPPPSSPPPTEAGQATTVGHTLKIERGSGGSVGLTFRRPKGSATGPFEIMDVKANGPAKSSGLEKGDYFCAVDGVDICALTMKEVATIFDGKPGAPLELTLCLASSSPIASVARESVGPIKEGEARSVERAQLSASGHGPLRAMKQSNMGTGFIREIKREPPRASGAHQRQHQPVHAVQQERIAARHVTDHSRQPPELPVNYSSQAPHHRTMPQPRQHAHPAPFAPPQQQQQPWNDPLRQAHHPSLSSMFPGGAAGAPGTRTFPNHPAGIQAPPAGANLGGVGGPGGLWAGNQGSMSMPNASNSMPAPPPGGGSFGQMGAPGASLGQMGAPGGSFGQTGAASSSNRGNFCTQCGSPSNQHNFCIHCGAKIINY